MCQFRTYKGTAISRNADMFVDWSSASLFQIDFRILQIVYVFPLMNDWAYLRHKTRFSFYRKVNITLPAFGSILVYFKISVDIAIVINIIYPKRRYIANIYFDICI